jgi:hypothetical protein
MGLKTDSYIHMVAVLVDNRYPRLYEYANRGERPPITVTLVKGYANA